MNPADLTLNISPSLSSKTLPTPALALKNGKAPVPRVDLEPIYTQLKASLGEGFNEYKAVVGAFILGQLSQAELSYTLNTLLTLTPPLLPTSTNGVSSSTPPVSTLHLHNTLFAALYANTLRDPPPTDVAPWVVATDKPAAASKNAGASGANDKAEERLKKEVMAIHPRDRRRIKTLKESGKPLSDGFSEMVEYRHELAVKATDVAPPGSAGGVGGRNWDIEIRRRYAQPLAEETLEFPTQDLFQARIEPICYEEGLVGGVAQGALQGCAELLEQATEAYLKEMLGGFYAHARANGEGCVMTGQFRRQVRKEEEGVEMGGLQRSAAGFLPVEMDVRAKRAPLNMEDMRLASQLGDNFMGTDPFLMERVMLGRQAVMSPEPLRTNGIYITKPILNGTGGRGGGGVDDVMMVDAPDHGWRGAAKGDMDDLLGVLDDCLAAG